MDTNPQPDGWLRLRIDAALARLTLERPDRLNALTRATLLQLDQALDTLEARDDVRVVLLSSTHPEAFCAGADITEWRQLPAARMWSDWTRIGHRIFDRLAGLPQPTIAVVDQVALGGGLELALACDFIVAADRARFGLPETRIGAVPGWGGTRRLSARIGAAQAKRLVFSGAIVDADEAFRLGIVQEHVAEASALPRALELATTIAGNAPTAVRLAKQLIDQRDGGLAAETIAAGLAAHGDDAREGVDAFLARRAPRYRGL